MEKLVTEAQSLLKTDPPNKNKKKKKDVKKTGQNS